MKTHKVLLILILSFLLSATLAGQSRTVTPQTPERYQQALNDTLNTRGRIVWVGGGAWWTNTALVERLGLTDDQKLRIERAFENHRSKLESCRDLLEKEEAQLARLLEAETIDRNAILTQTDRVIQARGEMERENATMTLEMREALTRTQWMQLPPPTWLDQGVAIRVNPNAPRGGGGRGTPGAGRGQQ